MNGCLALVLHAHLPYVRHPEFGESYEERWLYEAMLESYLPLLDCLERLAEDGVPFRLTLSLSPTLLEMLQDGLHRRRFVRYLDSRLELAGQEAHRTSHDPGFRAVVEMYLRRFLHLRRLYCERHREDLVAAFRRLADAGHLELLTTAATHAYLPLLEPSAENQRAQVRVGLDTFSRHLGVRPRGLWLPECGYRPGLDRVLVEEGVEYCVLDTPSLLAARPRPRHGGYAPVLSPSGLACFGRDLESGLEVWSAREGFPADPEYRDFYRDVGWDLPLDYVFRYVHESGKRLHTGLKYYRTTGPTNHKEVYRPSEALRVAELHASAYVANRSRQAEWLKERMGREPVIVAAFDAELFGHWWFEGPVWLELVLRKLHREPTGLEPLSLGACLDRFDRPQTVAPNIGSWGDGGFHARWLNPANHWVYRHLHVAGRRMVDLARRGDGGDEARRRGLNQAGRELLLAQASDWAFIMSTGAHADYARKRTRDHLVTFNRLYHEMAEGEVDPGALRKLEERTPLFDGLDYRVWR